MKRMIVQQREQCIALDSILTVLSFAVFRRIASDYRIVNALNKLLVCSFMLVFLFKRLRVFVSDIDLHTLLVEYSETWCI